MNRAILESLDDAELPPVLRAYLLKSEQALIAAGFQAPRYRRALEPGAVASCAALFEHAKDGVLGFTLVNAGMSGHVTAITAFTSYFADGRRLITTNSPSMLRTPPRPEVDAVRFRNLFDIRILYAIHIARMRERATRSAMVPMTRGPDPIAFADHEARETQSFWIRKGYYPRRFNAGSD